MHDGSQHQPFHSVRYFILMESRNWLTLRRFEAGSGA